ncbi:MAG TPA: glycosyltransferase [Methylomirabilota bacterium]
MIDPASPASIPGWRADRKLPLTEVPLPTRSPELLSRDIGRAAAARLGETGKQAVALLGNRTVWNINSTARGGGVAELLRTTLPYWRGSAIGARWLVLQGSPAFFRLTKRLHNMLHGDGGLARFGLAERTFFERVARVIGAEASGVVRAGDIVLLHDPQTAGLIPLLRSAGAVVIWRCHVGADAPSPAAEAAWDFLLPYVADADACVFTRRAFVPPGLDPRRVSVFAPAIDPCSPKNQALPPATAQAILAHCGLVPSHRNGSSLSDRSVPLTWGGEAVVQRRCRVMREARPRGADRGRLVVALSRWDHLKDPIGIMQAFAEHVDDPRARLIVAGPATVAVPDDPEGPAYLRAVRAAWAALPGRQRRRIDVAVLPMVDLDENALMVNALQSRAAVIVKKSVQEGFGLGVTEALWKARPVVATRVGGQQDQIQHRRTGLLVDDPHDLAGFGAAVNELLETPREDLEFGAAGRNEVREHYLADTHLVHWMGVLRRAIDLAGAGR